MFETQWLLALSGGMLVGLSALMLMLFNGRVAGISGILAGALQHRHAWRWLFLLGLGAGAWLAFSLGWARIPSFSALPTWPLVALAGLLVGMGTRLGNGCTSGHGICGMGRLSVRSLFATLTFMAAGFMTVFVTLHLL
ncbi:YeeE/YedE family protein [Aeromonas salmonicida]|uniref:YeeE/YedE family protein n=1 Tax=Aeromonas salmonicida TaxID=645 RepID=UPI001BA8C7F9|nr:YeeE/YedE thiosulfate transporter family protein [Aeromonas salmonicida]MBS2780390.1 YeeE/YedE family protein [Aeromonas salmonicida]MDR7021220.1 putative membrane protein YedE/YeeE [Aeromonas salmonicida]HEH9410761.1 YeeE/YedE family protein [Aeromonas salmonicida]